MERSKAGTKKSPNSLSQPNQNTINSYHNLSIFYKIWKKLNEIQLTKNKMDLNNLKMKNHPPNPPEIIYHLFSPT